MEKYGAQWDKFGDAQRRKIVETYTIGNYRVKLYTYHDKVKKSYWSIISECQIEESGTSKIYFERHRIHEDLNQLAGRIDVSRYNWSNMERAHCMAAQTVQDQVMRLLAAHSLAA
jgi:hypothetical protein